MSIRLNKAIRELNIGLQTAADFLMKKYGVEGADNPALKLTDEWYEGLCKEFSTDAAVRTQVDKMAQKVKEKKPSIAIEKSEEQPAEQPAKQQYKPLGKIDLSQVGKPKVKKDEEKEIKKTEEEKIYVRKVIQTERKQYNREDRSCCRNYNIYDNGLYSCG